MTVYLCYSILNYVRFFFVSSLMMEKNIHLLISTNDTPLYSIILHMRSHHDTTRGSNSTVFANAIHELEASSSSFS
ncbi:hypothetical protein C8R42DRAFT_277192 [Lentinula raphanica]|nr:hypothetical protein C8R42DRAFT_277192 [Lentinula raphanica]